MTAFSEDQIAALRAPLARDHVKTRSQSGRTLSYIEGWVAISEANRIFGPDGWTRETVMSECCYAGEYERQGKTSYRCSYRARVRVTVGDIVREGSGHGHGYADNPGEAHESAEKEAETDAMKRALMTFGNPFGLALYDKTQAEVEPVGGRPAPLTPVEAAAHPTERERKVLAAREARKRITESLATARTPAIIDEVIERNSAALDEIKALHGPSYEAIMALAGKLKSDIYAATG